MKLSDVEKSTFLQLLPYWFVS